MNPASRLSFKGQNPVAYWTISPQKHHGSALYATAEYECQVYLYEGLIKTDCWVNETQRLESG